MHLQNMLAYAKLGLLEFYAGISKLLDTHFKVLAPICLES